MFFYQGINQFTRKLRRVLLLLFSIWILLAVVLIFLDLPLSIFLVNTNSSWAKFVALYGEIPGHIVISISIFVLLSDRVTDPNWSQNPVFWFGLILNSVFMANILLAFFPQYNVELKYGLILTGFVVIGQFVIIMRLKEVEMLSDQKYTRFAKISLIMAIINPLLFVQTTKLLWGRTRFRDLTGDYQEFTPWLFPQGLTGHKSFPSGHTAMGWMVLPLLFILPKTGRIRWVFHGLIISWGIFIAFGRIVIGAHYASDVLFSTGMAFLVYIILVNHKKPNDSQTKPSTSEHS